jgi:hypothetical protein
MGVTRRGFIWMSGAGALALVLGGRAWAAVGRAAKRAFPKAPWKKVERDRLREPHDLAG